MRVSASCLSIVAAAAFSRVTLAGNRCDERVPGFWHLIATLTCHFSNELRVERTMRQGLWDASVATD
jgi:hypothetical protein